MGLKLGVVGAGSFSPCFIPLFQSHPLVEEVVLCDLCDKKLQELGDRFHIERRISSLDELLKTDVSAVAIITQNWLHAPQAIQALRSGKDVYSAVPAGVSLEEIAQLANEVRKSERIYMMGETSHYSPYVVYCRKQFEEGAFGDVVYSEGEYLHDMDHGLYDVYRSRAGDAWLEEAGIPPMYYPTHAIAMTVGVTQAYPTQVSCMGWVDKHTDGVYKPGVNRYDNIYSDQTAIYKMSDGSVMRHNDFRRIGYGCAERGSMYGTLGSFEVNAKAPIWVSKDGTVTDLSDELNCIGIPADPKERNDSNVPKERRFSDTCKAHDVDRLPQSFAGLPNGHGGSHQFLVDDFVQACVSRKHPPVNVWQAARYTIPGIIAHDSCVRGGVLLNIPDLGDCPFN